MEKIINEKMGQPELGRADLHIHSSYSYDGLAKPETLMKKASEIGLNVIAITDHEEIRGAEEALRLEKKYGVEVIVGEEVLTNQGEVLGLFLKEKLKPGKTLEETIRTIHSQGGLAIIPHPFSWFPVTRPAVGIKRLYSLIRDKRLFPDGIETFNSMPVGRFSSKKSKEINERVFNLAEVAGSDSHIADHLGMGITLFPGRTKEDLKRAIMERKTKVSGGFVSGKGQMKIIGKNIAKRTKSAGKKILKPYYKLKNSINKKFF